MEYLDYETALQTLQARKALVLSGALDRRSIELLAEVVHSISDLKRGFCPSCVMRDFEHRVSKI